MTDHQQHPTISPPLGLVRQWITEARSQDYCSIAEQVAYRAAQWVCEQCGKADEAKLQKARDEELEACCALMDDWGLDGNDLMECRRPKLPSLHEQGMRILTENGTTLDGRIELDPEDIDTFHAVLVRLKQLEDSND